MFRSALASLAVCASLLAGCTETSNPGVSESLVPRNSEAVLTYQFEPGSARLSAGTRNRITQFLDRFRLTSDDIVVISVPGVGVAARHAELRAVMQRYPSRLKLVGDGGMAASGDNSGRGIIKVIRAWGAESICQSSAGAFGCANSGNLAQMVAVPADLTKPIQGRRFFPQPQSAPAASSVGGALP